MKSSESDYHVVFDKKVTWSENMSIVAWISLLSHNRVLEKWFLMQCIKEGSTLRISPKRDRPSPRIIFRYGKQNEQIQDFSAYRNIGRNIIAKLRKRNACMQTLATIITN